MPRPTIWTYRDGDIVGRTRAITSTTGASKPVVSTSQEAMHCTLRDLNAAMMTSRSPGGVSPTITSVEIPSIRVALAMRLACATLVPNTNADVRPLSRAVLMSDATASLILSTSLASSRSLAANSPMRVPTPLRSIDAVA